jgi:hypothetical protein
MWVLAAGGGAGSVTSVLMGKGRWAVALAAVAFIGLAVALLIAPAGSD